MKARIKLLYDGSWTQWYDEDKLLSEELAGLNVEACIIEETMTKEQAEEFMKKFEPEFKFK